MDKPKEMVHEAVTGTQNTTSNQIELETQKLPLNAESNPSQIASNPTCTDQPNVQQNNNRNNNSSKKVAKSSPTKTKKQDEGNKQQSHQESAKEASASEVDAKPKKAKQRLRKGKWTVSVHALMKIDLNLWTYLIHPYAFLDRRRRIYIEDNSVLQHRTPHFAGRSNSAFLSRRKVELRSDANHQKIHRSLLFGPTCLPFTRSPESFSCRDRNGKL